MPGVMALHKQDQDDKPLAGAHIVGCTHISIYFVTEMQGLMALRKHAQDDRPL